MEQALRLPDTSASSEVPATSAGSPTSSVPATSQKITSLAANQSIMPFDLMDESSSETTFRVAFYIRVSTDTEDQLNSFVAQRQACYLTMSMHPEYILTNIYADEAISGTQAAKRPGFMKMIQDAESGLIDLIITKSLSRWSRNTLDSLTYMRRLMDKGVNFLFEREGIDTRNHFSEFAVTLYSAFAQEESRSISENTKMGIRMQFSMGQARWCPVFGYKRDNEEYEIDPDQAIVVRDIFSRYETGTAIKKIADHLNESGIPTVRGGKWSNCTIAHILGNRKYVGDLPMQSFYTKDHISHAAVKNNGDDIPTYMVENHHKAIISREQFDRVQTIMKLRNPEKGSFQYPFGDMLHCPYCSGSLTQHRGSGTRRVWFCQCGRFALPAWTVEKVLLKAAEGLDVEEIEKRSKDEEYSASARLALELIRGKMLEKVEYHWIDKMISGFDFELLPADTGCNLFKAPRVMMTVRWKFGIESRMIIDHLYRSPEKLAQRMASIAQNESYSISENIRTANRKRFTKGKYSPGNHVCLGYKAEDGKLVPDENADVVRAIFDLFLQGKRYQGICDELNAKQSATKRGSTEPDKTYHLTRSTVKYILHNEVYVGDKNLLRTPRRELFSKLPVKTESIYIKYDHEPLIDRETWEEAQKRLESLSKGEVKVDYKHKGGKPHFLHGKVICGECASLMTRRTRREYRKKGEKVATYKAWICSGRVKGSGCQGRIIREDEVLAVIRVRLGYSPKRKVDAAEVEGVQEIRVGEEDVEVRMNES